MKSKTHTNKVLIMILSLLPIIAYSIEVNFSGNWGATGHRVIGEVANLHISKRTAKALNELLNGESLAYVSNFGDDIKSDKKYNEYYSWHYANLDLDQTYAESDKNSKGDIIIAIQNCINILKNRSESKRRKHFFLKLGWKRYKS